MLLTFVSTRDNWKVFSLYRRLRHNKYNRPNSVVVACTSKRLQPGKLHTTDHSECHKWGRRVELSALESPLPDNALDGLLILYPISCFVSSDLIEKSGRMFTHIKAFSVSPGCGATGG